MSTEYYYCKGDYSDKSKPVSVIEIGTVYKLWNEYQYDVQIVLNLTDFVESTVVIVPNPDFQTLSVNCTNYTKIEFVPQKQFVYALLNNKEIRCSLKGFIISNQYIAPHELAFKEIKIIPYIFSSVKKSFFNDTQLLDPEMVSQGRHVAGNMYNPTDYTVIVDFKLFRSIGNDLETQQLLSSGKFELWPKGEISIYALDDYNDSFVYWFNPIPYFKIQYSLVKKAGFIDLTPKPKKVSGGGGSWVGFEEETKNETPEESIPIQCYVAFRKDIIHYNYDEKVVTVQLSFLNPCNESRKIAFIDPIGDEFAVLELPFGHLVDKKIFYNFTILPHSKMNFNYTLKYLGKDNLALLPGLIVYDLNSSFASDNIPLIFGPVKESVLYVMKRLNFIGENDVKVDLTLRNYGNPVKFYLKDVADFYSALTVQFFKRGMWEISLLENEEFSISYITQASEKMYYLPQVFGFSGKIFYSLISTSKVKEKVSVNGTTIEYFGIFLIVSVVLIGIYGVVLSILSHFKESFEWYSIKSQINKYKKMLK